MEEKTPISPPGSISKSSLIGTAFCAMKNYFTPERISRRPNPMETGITPMMASLSLNESLQTSCDSFKTSQSMADDSYKSIYTSVEDFNPSDTTLLNDNTVLMSGLESWHATADDSLISDLLSNNLSDNKQAVLNESGRSEDTSEDNQILLSNKNKQFNLSELISQGEKGALKESGSTVDQVENSSAEIPDASECSTISFNDTIPDLKLPEKCEHEKLDLEDHCANVEDSAVLLNDTSPEHVPSLDTNNAFLEAENVVIAPVTAPTPASPPVVPETQGLLEEGGQSENFANIVVAVLPSETLNTEDILVVCPQESVIDEMAKETSSKIEIPVCLLPAESFENNMLEASSVASALSANSAEVFTEQDQLYIQKNSKAHISNLDLEPDPELSTTGQGSEEITDNKEASIPVDVSCSEKVGNEDSLALESVEPQLPETLLGVEKTNPGYVPPPPMSVTSETDYVDPEDMLPVSVIASTKKEVLQSVIIEPSHHTNKSPAVSISDSDTNYPIPVVMENQLTCTIEKSSKLSFSEPPRIEGLEVKSAENYNGELVLENEPIENIPVESDITNSREKSFEEPQPQVPVFIDRFGVEVIAATEGEILQSEIEPSNNAYDLPVAPIYSASTTTNEPIPATPIMGTMLADTSEKISFHEPAATVSPRACIPQIEELDGKSDTSLSENSPLESIIVDGRDKSSDEPTPQLPVYNIPQIEEFDGKSGELVAQDTIPSENPSLESGIADSRDKSFYKPKPLLPVLNETSEVIVPEPTEIPRREPSTDYLEKQLSVNEVDVPLTATEIMNTTDNMQGVCNEVSQVQMRSCNAAEEDIPKTNDFPAGLIRQQQLDTSISSADVQYNNNEVVFSCNENDLTLPVESGLSENLENEPSGHPEFDYHQVESCPILPEEGVINTFNVDNEHSNLGHDSSMAEHSNFDISCLSELERDEVDKEYPLETIFEVDSILETQSPMKNINQAAELPKVPSVKQESAQDITASIHAECFDDKTSDKTIFILDGTEISRSSLNDEQPSAGTSLNNVGVTKDTFVLEKSITFNTVDEKRTLNVESFTFSVPDVPIISNEMSSVDENMIGTKLQKNNKFIKTTVSDGVLKEVNHNVIKFSDFSLKDEVFKSISELDIFNVVVRPDNSSSPGRVDKPRESVCRLFDPFYKSKSKETTPAPNVEELLELDLASFEKERENLLNYYREREEQTNADERANQDQMQKIDAEIEYCTKKLIAKEEQNKILEVNSSNLILKSQLLSKLIPEFKSFEDSLKEQSGTNTSSTCVKSLMAEKDSYEKHLKSAEAAFIDVFSKYEKVKGTCEELKGTASEREQELYDLRNKLSNIEDYIVSLDLELNTELERINKLANDSRLALHDERNRLLAQIRKTELERDQTQEKVEKITIENKEITTICDNLINGSSR